VTRALRMTFVTFSVLLAAGEARARPGGSLPLPDQSESSQPMDLAAIQPFWRRISDPDLVALVEEGLAANADIAQAVARLDGARARSRAAGARLAPSLGAGLSSSRSVRIKTIEPASLVPDAAQLNLAYEVDLFGSVRKGRRTARASARAVAFDVASVRLAVACQILRSHAVIHALDALRRITAEQIEGTARTAALIDRRAAEHEAGPVETALVAQQLAGLEAYRAQLGAVRAAEVAALAVVLGREPESFVVPASDEAGDGRNAADRALASLAPSPVQPLALLAGRPDVQAAGQALAAARWNADAVRASRWPNLTLTASGIGGLSGGLPLAFANLGASLGAALFGGGAIAAREGLARADTAQTLAFYNRTRLVAAQETIAALSAMEAATARVARWDQARALVARGVDTAQQAYLDGDVPINVLVDTRNDEIASRRALIEAQRDLALARIDVIRATGGTPQWEGSRGEGSRGEAPEIMANAR